MTNLAKMKPGSRGVVQGFSKSLENQSLATRLMEMGLTVGARLEIVHEAPFGGAIAVRCRGTLIALRLDDAELVEISPEALS